jgi:chromosome segregation ATPase
MKFAVSDAWHSIKIREFEHVLAAPSVALLRVSGRTRRRHSGAGARPVLLADDGQTTWRFVAIPSPPDDRGLLRAAYSVNANLVTSSTVFSLQLTDGSVIALPEPRPGAARLARASNAESSADSSEPTEQPPATEERRSELVTKLTELSAALAEAEQARGRLETEANEARTEAERAGAQLAPLRGRVADLEKRLTEADQRAVNGALELSATQERADELQRACRQLEQANEEQRGQLGKLERDLAAAVTAHDELERSVAPLRVSLEQAEHGLTEAQEAVHMMTIERDELGRQTSAFDAVAIKARERASEAEAEAEKATAAAQELETWSGELERRLTETTDELRAAKTAGARDEAELRRLGGVFAEAEAKIELIEAQLKTFKLSPSEREHIALEAEKLAARLASADRLTELARELSDAHAQAENLRAALQAAVSAEPGSQARADEEALAGAREEIDQLRAELAQEPDPEADARIDALRHAAEAEARELAEHELTQATTDGQ